MSSRIFTSVSFKPDSLLLLLAVLLLLPSAALDIRPLLVATSWITDRTSRRLVTSSVPL
jgi:hypothetical protein